MSEIIRIKTDSPKIRNTVVRDMILSGRGKGATKKLRHKTDRRPKDARRIREVMQDTE